MKRKFFWIFPIFLALFIWACSSDDDTEDPTDDVGMTDDDGGTSDDDGVSDDDGSSVTFDRGTMLANWADNIILPSYTAFLNTHGDLKTEFETFQDAPSEENLASLRDAWIEAYKSWQHISMFETGPAEDNGLRLNINTYPTDVELITDNIENTTYNLDLPSNRDAKGFPALDYLLNGMADSDAEIVAIFTEANSGDVHLAYVSDIIDDIETRVTTVRDAWQSGYRDTFVENDGSSATASVDRYVNDFIFYYEKFLRAGKMGIPLGVFTGIQAPNTIESFYYPQLSNDLFQEGLNAVQDFFSGVAFGTDDQGESLASYLTALNEAELRDDILDQFESARTAVAALEPFRTEIETNNPAVDMFAAYDEVQRNVAFFKVDMVSAMSIAIDFVDADGD
ncbi:MAG: imelysin family protein [Bacteroidota bacterium]